MRSSLAEPYIVFGPSVPRQALPAVHSMAASAVPLSGARVSSIAQAIEPRTTTILLIPSILPRRGWRRTVSPYVVGHVPSASILRSRSHIVAGHKRRVLDRYMG